MTPTAFTLALRRSQRLHQPGDAGRARHVALHVLHAGRRLDRNSAGVEAHALADERDRRLAFAAAVPAHHHDAAFARRALADTEQRVHAELFQRGKVKHFHGDAGLFQASGAAGEFFRIEDVRRFVDQIARKVDAVGDRLAPRKSRTRRSNVAHRDAHFDGGATFLLLALGLVAIEGIGAQAHALGKIGRARRAHGAAGQFGEHGSVAGIRRQLAHGDAAEFEEILRLQITGLADPDHQQPRNFQSLRHDQFQHRAAFAGETSGFGSARDEVATGSESPLGSPARI